MAFFQIVLASRYIDLTGFGTYALGWASAVIIVAFVYTGFYQALLRSTAFEDERDTGFWLMAAIGGGGAVLLAAVAWALADRQPATAAVFLALAPFPLLRAPVAWNELHLVRSQRVRLVSSYGMVSELLALGVTFVALERGLGVMALIFGRYVTILVELAITLLAVRVLPRLRLSLAHFRRLRVTAFPLWGTSALAMFSNYGADLILGAFLNPAAVGAYRGGARISQTAADLVFQPLNTISWSRFSRLEKQGDVAGMRQSWLANMGFGAALLWPMLASFALLSEDLVTVLFGPTWLPSAAIIGILSLSRALGFMSALLEPALVCRGQGAAQMRIRAVSAAILLAALLLFGRNGAAPAAWSVVLAQGVTAVVALVVMLPALDLRLSRAARAMLPAVIVTALCAIGLWATEPLRAGLAGSAGLWAAIAGLALFWFAAAAVCLRRGWLVLPAP